jgi:Na+-driven multidrug efflux pump
MGKALEASIVALSRQGLFLLPSIFILGPLLGLDGIQLSRPVSEIASLVVVIPILIRTLKILSAPDGI